MIYQWQQFTENFFDFFFFMGHKQHQSYHRKNCLANTAISLSVLGSPHYDLSSSILGYVAYAFSPLPEATMISTRLRGGEDRENTGGRSLMSNPAVSAVFNT